MEGFLPVEWALVWYVVAAPFVAYGGYRTAGLVRGSTTQKAVLAVAAAFVFVLSALKLPSITGSTTHPTGTGIAVVLLGPSVTAFLSVVVLLYQALLLAHGGISTLGANVVSMGVVGPAVGWGVYVLARRTFDLSTSTFLATVAADWSTYVVTSAQLAFAFPTHPGPGGVVAALTTFLGVFAVTQVPIGLLDGLLAGTLIRYVVQSTDGAVKRPEVPA